jgi:hypothetical protein
MVLPTQKTRCERLFDSALPIFIGQFGTFTTDSQEKESASAFEFARVYDICLSLPLFCLFILSVWTLEWKMLFVLMKFVRLHI